nr:retrotransposon protein, putative, Ty1-copia subclass [Tanacetum cinerariifolium]
MATLNSMEIKERSKVKGDDGEGLYVRGRTDRELNASVEEKDSLAQVWHKRLRRISEAGLQVLEKQGLFGKKSLDLWGPSQVESLGGKRYFLSIVDDYSRRVWVYLLWFKHGAFENFKEWKQLVENSTGRTVKKLRTDNGLEFCNREFKQLCIESGIARHLTVAGTLQQSGLNNHTLEEDQTDNEDQTNQDDDHQARQKLVTCKWLFKIKEGIEGVQKPRYKARLVARGFTQREEVIYIRQPQGYEQGNKVCLLKKSLYGLKQPPRQWYMRFDEYMLSNGFKRSSYDICVYYRSYAPGKYIYQLLYVDDMLIACKSKAEIGSTKSLLKREFDMKDLGEAKKILGMEIVRDRSRKIIRVSQSGYISMILNNFRIDNGKSVQMPLSGHFKLSLKDCPIRDCDVERMSKVSYANAMGSLMYLMVCTRPDIAYAISIVSRYLVNPGMCCKLEGNATIRGGSFNYKGRVYGPYGGCKGSYLAKETLGRVREVLEAKTVEVLKVGTEHNVVDALTKVVPGHKLQHCLELLSVGIG